MQNHANRPALSIDDLLEVFAANRDTSTPLPNPSQHGLSQPHPVAARNDGILAEVHSALEYYGHGAALGDPNASEVPIVRALQGIYRGHPELVMVQWTEINRAMYATVSLAHARRAGRILRATDALETLLAHTDIDTNLPTSMFQPPHPALYIHFGPEWRERIRATLGPALALSGATLDEVAVHGCYLIQSLTHCEACERMQRTLGVYLTIEFLAQPGNYAFGGGANVVLHDEEAPLTETLIRKLDCGVPGGVHGKMPTILIDLLAKLFLYMQTESAQITAHYDRSEQERRLTRLGGKKLGKLERRLERLYDWTEIGPATQPNDVQPHELSAHWQRGHLR